MIRKIFLIAICLINITAIAQEVSKDDEPLAFEEMYDEPYGINKLFVQIQPVYGEIFVANINAGFGLEICYYFKDKLDLRASTRMTYAKQFDFSRDLAEKNNALTTGRSGVTNVSEVYNFMEFGGTFHLKDFEKDSETSIYLYKDSKEGETWEAKIPTKVNVPSKIRKIIGVRFGGISYSSSTDFKRALEEQGLSYADLLTKNNETLEGVITSSGTSIGDVSLFGNVHIEGAYFGGSMTWIRNVAINFDGGEYERAVDDLILTAFADVIVGRVTSVEDISYKQIDDSPEGFTNYSFNSDPLTISKIGFRLGLDGKFNRTVGWGYGAEVGSKPTLKGRGMYALIKVSFPVFSTNFRKKEKIE